METLITRQEQEEQQKFNALQKLGNDTLRTGKILHDFRKNEPFRNVIIEVTEYKRYALVMMKLGNIEGVFFAQNELKLLLLL